MYPRKWNITIAYIFYLDEITITYMDELIKKSHTWMMMPIYSIN